MKKFISVAIVAATFGLATSAIADPIVITDSVNVYGLTTGSTEYVASGGSSISYLESTGDFVSFNHEFNFDPAAASINRASLVVTFNNRINTTDNDVNVEFAFIQTDSDFNFQQIIPGVSGGIYNISGSSVMDGYLGVTITSLLGDFYVKASNLTISYNPVPEPTTMLLFGTGLLGLAAVGRRRTA